MCHACFVRTEQEPVPGSGISSPIQAPIQTGLTPKRRAGHALIRRADQQLPTPPSPTMPLGAGGTDGPIRCYAACDGTSPAGNALLLVLVEGPRIEVTACALRTRATWGLVRFRQSGARWGVRGDVLLVVFPSVTASRRILHARDASRPVNSAVVPALW